MIRDRHFSVFWTYSNSMMEKLKTLVSLIIIIICLPYLVTFVVQGDFLNEVEQPEDASADPQEDTEHLLLILANEMPATFEKEALKAQAVIARTNLAYAREHDEAEPEGMSRVEMREQLGAEKFRKQYDYLKSCIEETAGEVAVYKKKVVQLPYHFVSAGQTRDLGEVDEKDSMPYLKSVSSSQDVQSERFLKIEFLSKKQFYNKLKDAYPKLEFKEDSLDQMAAVEKRDSASYVLVVELPGKKVSGEEFRGIFSLNSTCFSLKETDGQIRIVTKGYGQGYGLSQYGANEMAREGSTYREILDHYYDGLTYSQIFYQ